MMRGALVGIIYDKTLDLESTASEDSAAVTLMSTDIDRIALGFSRAHEIWASALEVVLAVWLLEKQIGIACLAPVVIALGEHLKFFPLRSSCFYNLTMMTASTFGSSRVAAVMGDRQKRWVAAIEKRVAVTSSALGSMKSVKMLGISESLASIITKYRVDELVISKPYRWCLLFSNLFCESIFFK